MVGRTNFSRTVNIARNNFLTRKLSSTQMGKLEKFMRHGFTRLYMITLKIRNWVLVNQCSCVKEADFEEKMIKRRKTMRWKCRRAKKTKQNLQL